jgi:hypothetical protein
VQIGTRAALPGSTFLNGARPDSNATQVKLGSEPALGRNAVLFAAVDGAFADHDQFYRGKARSLIRSGKARFRPNFPKAPLAWP